MKRFLTILMFLASFILGVFAVNLQANAGILDFFYKTKEYLAVSGNKILLNNENIYLRGVAVGDSHLRVEEYKRGIDDYADINDNWKANLVRLSVHPGAFKSNPKKVKKDLDDEITAARENGLFVIVNWHVIGFPDGWYKQLPYDDSSLYSYDSNFITANDFWKYMAVKYRSDRGVMFELWNEPARDDFGWEEFKPYMQRLHDLIRSNGAENIIIVPGIWWTYDLGCIGNDPLKGENIAYAWHNYPNCGSYMSWSEALGGMNEKFPVIVTEWGFSSKDKNKHYYSTLDSDYSKYFKKYLLDNSLHFTAWCWHNTWEPNMFNKDWQSLTDYGEYIKKFLVDIDSGLAYLDIAGIGNLEERAQNRIFEYIKSGLGDRNSIFLGEGERKAVIYSYEEAFGKLPETEEGIEDIKKIANGNWPSRRSFKAEERAKEKFKYIYQREPDMDYPCDNAAVTVMSYGLRQKAENRNLESEKWGMIVYKNLFNELPETTSDWNVLQAITYSGAKR